MSALWRIELLGGLRAIPGPAFPSGVSPPHAIGRGDWALTHFRTQKTGALLGYLAYHLGERPHPREELIGLLWPDSEPGPGRNNLSKELSWLRGQLEPAGVPDGAVIIADRLSVRLKPSAVTTDAAAFETHLREAARAANDAGRVRSLAGAIDEYQGSLLNGYWDDWILGERERLAERYAQAVSRLVALLEQAADFDRAIDYARRAVRGDPLREEGHRDLIRLLMAVGQPAAALRQYRELERLLRRELGSAPEAATRELLASLNARFAGRAEWVRPPRAGALPSAPLPGEAEPIGRPPGPLPGKSGRKAGGGETAETSFSPSRPLAPGGEEGEEPAATRVVLLYRRRAQPDEDVVHLLEAELTGRGYSVFVDRHLSIGVAWAAEIEREISEADAVILLLSADSVRSGMLAYELRVAHEAAGRQEGRPRLLPVRLALTDPLPEPLAVLLDPLEYALWEGPGDSSRLIADLVEALCRPADPVPAAPRAPPAPPVDMEPVGGAVPLDSTFYVARSTDGEFYAAIRRGDSIVLVQGARQMGKTSLLARGLQQARAAGARVLYTDLQALAAAHLASVDAFFLALAHGNAVQLGLEVLPRQAWNPDYGPNLNFELYLQREVLGERGATVWGLNEVDRLFDYDFAGDIFGLFRSWHNKRSFDPTGPWSRLTLVMTYATEAHLFITDPNRSPFNVGTRLMLADFTVEQVADLNRRYGSPLRGAREIERLHRLVGGHPHLVRRGLHEMATHGTNLAAIEAEADEDTGIYGDHLRRLLASLAREAELCEVVRGVLRGDPCPMGDSFHRLRGAGVLIGASARDARLRCPLYARYLARHLL